MSKFSGIHDLAYVFTRVGGSVDAGARQDWVAMGANLAGGAGKLVWYAKGHGEFKKVLDRMGKEALPTPTAIIDTCQICVAVIDLLNGFGSPESGSRLASGVDKYKVVDLNLRLASPKDSGWSGPAATEYKETLEGLRSIVAAMQELDRQAGETVAKQGAVIYQAHRTMAILGFALVFAQGVALLMYLIPVVGPEISMLFQIVTALATATTVVITEMEALNQSLNHAREAEAAAASYLELGKSADLKPKFATINVQAAQETSFSSFEKISNSVSAFSAPPSVASLARFAGDSAPESQRTLLNALIDSDTPTDHSAEPTVEMSDAGNAPAEGTAPTDGPRFAPLTMTQLTQMSKQVAQLSANVAQPLNVGNQVMGPVQQIVSMAQQGQGAEAPEEPEGLGAVSGAEAAERAPVDVAAEGGQGQETGAMRQTL